MNDTAARDERALELRSVGKSFAAIADIVSYERPREANDAFNRALRRKPEAERDRLRGDELGRLDAMAQRISAREDLDPDRIAGHLRSVDRLRTMLLAD